MPARGPGAAPGGPGFGLVLQTTSLDAQLTVTEALSLFGARYPSPRDVGEVLEVIDMTDDARTKIGVLTGRQRRRVDLGIAVIGQPEVLFLNPPMTGWLPSRYLPAAVTKPGNHVDAPAETGDVSAHDVDAGDLAVLDLGNAGKCRRN